MTFSRFIGITSIVLYFFTFVFFLFGFKLHISVENLKLYLTAILFISIICCFMLLPSILFFFDHDGRHDNFVFWGCVIIFISLNFLLFFFLFKKHEVENFYFFYITSILFFILALIVYFLLIIKQSSKTNKIFKYIGITGWSLYVFVLFIMFFL